MLKYLIAMVLIGVLLTYNIQGQEAPKTTQTSILQYSWQTNGVQSDSTVKADSTWALYMSKTKASFYGGEKHGKNYDGCRTANGERFDTYNGYTFAVKSKLRGKKINGVAINFNTIIKVTNINNNKFVIVRCNDTGGLTANRSIDLSRIAMDDLDGIGSGVIDVKIEVLQQ